MHDALRRLVLIPSGTYNKAGVDAVCREIMALLEELPLERRIVPQEQYGDMLIASVPPADSGAAHPSRGPYGYDFSRGLALPRVAGG